MVMSGPTSLCDIRTKLINYCNADFNERSLKLSKGWARTLITTVLVIINSSDSYLKTSNKQAGLFHINL